MLSFWETLRIDREKFLGKVTSLRLDVLAETREFFGKRQDENESQNIGARGTSCRSISLCSRPSMRTLVGVNMSRLRACWALSRPFVTYNGFNDFRLPIDAYFDDAPRLSNPEKLMLKIDVLHTRDYAALPRQNPLKPPESRKSRKLILIRHNLTEISKRRRRKEAGKSMINSFRG
jgi:hypothetical protein